jgi:hypothetical protein
MTIIMFLKSHDCKYLEMNRGKVPMLPCCKLRSANIGLA